MRVRKAYKVAYCTPSLYIAGGIERVLTTKANYMADKLGYDVTIILTDGEGKEPFYPLSDKVKIIQLNIGFEELWNQPLIKKAYLYWKKMRLYKKLLTETLMELRPDITVTLLRREINFITSIPDGSGKIGEMHVNRDNYRTINIKCRFIRNFIQKRWRRQLIENLKKLDRLVVLTKDENMNWPEIWKREVIPNPLAKFPEELAPLTQKRAISVGRYVFEKGYDRLIDVWKIVAEKYPDWQIHVYGSGSQGRLEVLAKEAKLEDKIIFHDVSYNIYQYYAQSSFFVCCSRFEGFGMVLAESMSSGVPCISFDCPNGPRHIISHGTDGFLVPDGDIEQMARRIIYMIENPQERIEMGRKARENIARLEIEEIMILWDDLFLRVYLDKHPDQLYVLVP